MWLVWWWIILLVSQGSRHVQHREHGKAAKHCSVVLGDYTGFREKLTVSCLTFVYVATYDSLTWSGNYFTNSMGFLDHRLMYYDRWHLHWCEKHIFRGQDTAQVSEFISQFKKRILWKVQTAAIIFRDHCTRKSISYKTFLFIHVRHFVSLEVKSPAAQWQL